MDEENDRPAIGRYTRVFGSIAVEEFVMLFVSFVFELLFNTDDTRENLRNG